MRVVLRGCCTHRFWLHAQLVAALFITDCEDGEAESRAEDGSGHAGAAGAGIVVAHAHDHVDAGLGGRAGRNAPLHGRWSRVGIEAALTQVLHSLLQVPSCLGFHVAFAVPIF